jgi:hypothetical protein
VNLDTASHRLLFAKAGILLVDLATSFDSCLKVNPTPFAFYHIAWGSFIGWDWHSFCFLFS